MSKIIYIYITISISNIFIDIVTSNMNMDDHDP